MIKIIILMINPCGSYVIQLFLAHSSFLIR
jgi:hypothetical protein